MFLTFIALFLLFSIGYLAQTTGLCLVRGVSEAFALDAEHETKKPQFLLAILLSGSGSLGTFAVAYALSLEISGTFVYLDISLAFAAIFGGLLFGTGAALNGGCGVSTLSKLARGKIVMLATIIGWIFGWFLLAITLQAIGSFVTTLFASNTSFIDEMSFYVSPHFRFGVIGAVFVGVFTWALFKGRELKLMWLSMLAIGFMGSLVFLIEPGWTPSSFLKGFIQQTVLNQGSSEFLTVRYFYITALVAGMFCAAFLTASFAFERAKIKGIFTHFMAGTLMGIGGAIAGGGNDNQLLVSLPALSIYGLLAVGSMVGSIYFVKCRFK